MRQALRTQRGKGRKVLIIVQNLPVPFDRRVWQEANELTPTAYQVSIICPKGRGYEKRHEVLDGISIYRHPLPFEAKGALGYVIGILLVVILGIQFRLLVFLCGMGSMPFMPATRPMTFS